MKYKNIISNLWLVNSAEYGTKLNKDLRENFPNSSEVSNALGVSFPFIEFNIDKVLIDVYKDIYRIEKKFKKSIEFKEWFEEIKKNNTIGEGNITYLNVNGEYFEEKFALFKGHFSCYVVILQHFFFCYFIDKIKSQENSKINSLNTFLAEEKKRISLIPYVHFIQYGFFEFNKKYDINDTKEYVEIIIDLIDKLEQKSIIDFKNLNDLDTESLFSNSQTENFFYFIIKKNINKKNEAFFSKLYRYFIKEGYLKNVKPRFYFEFLNNSEIFKNTATKIQTPSVTNEEDIFKKFDELLFEFLFNQ
ncbi:hypothetical protein [Polaribacter sp.]|uniref:hypothetical protein n=1 Tax=Polaribacter sp. TaxID=1920175 RepID=UPI00404879F1